MDSRGDSRGGSPGPFVKHPVFAEGQAPRKRSKSRDVARRRHRVGPYAVDESGAGSARGWYVKDVKDADGSLLKKKLRADRDRRAETAREETLDRAREAREAREKQREKQLEANEADRRGLERVARERAAYANWRKRVDFPKVVCTQVPTMAQKGGICWFMALYTSLFFSQHLRTILIPRVWDMSETTKEAAHMKRTLVNILEVYDGKAKTRDDLMNSGFKDMKPHRFLGFLRRQMAFGYVPKNSKWTVDDKTSKDHGKVKIDTKMGHLEGNFWMKYQHGLLALLGIPHLSVHFENGRWVYSPFNMDLREGETATSIKFIEPIGKSIDIERPDVLIVHPPSVDWNASRWLAARSGHAFPEVAQLKGRRHPPKSLGPSVPTVMEYNGESYLLDSVVMYSTSREETVEEWKPPLLKPVRKPCDHRHAVAGVTCQHERYVFNGWAVDSGDAAMGGAVGGSSAMRPKPCPLMKREWAVAREFCLDAEGCTVPDATAANLRNKKTFCFSADRGTRVYVRANAILDAITV